MTSARESFAALLREDFGPLLADDDVSAAHIGPDGSLTLTRRGQAEAIEAKATDLVQAALAACKEGPLRSWLSGEQPALADARISAARAGSGVHIHLEKRARARLPLSRLEEVGMLPPGFLQEMMADISGGGGLLALGPSQYAAHQLVVASADAVARFAPTFVLSGRAVDEGRTDLVTGQEVALGLPPYLPSEAAAVALHPAPEAESLVAAAWESVAVGARYLVAVDLAKEELSALLDAELPLVLLAHLRAPSFDASRLSESHAVSVCCTMGFDPRGAPRLAMCIRDGVEPAMATRADSQIGMTQATAHPRPATSTGAPAPALPTAMPASNASAPLSQEGLAAPPMQAPGGGPELPPLQPLGPAPPSDWMSDAPEMDPGWDVKSESDLALGHLRQPTTGEDALEPKPRATSSEASGSPNPDAPPSTDVPEENASLASPSAFAQTLKNVAKRPPFKPAKPSEHPQAKKLREDPFGGLTFEPPSHPSPASDETEGEAEDAGSPTSLAPGSEPDKEIE